jgi:hypothetical protein
MEDPTQKAKITAAQARALLPELNASGLPLAEFARQRGIAAAPLYNGRRSARLKDARSRRAAFAEVVVARPDSSPRAATNDHFEVDLPNRLTLRIPRDFDDVTLRRLLGTLSAC